MESEAPGSPGEAEPGKQLSNLTARESSLISAAMVVAWQPAISRGTRSAIEDTDDAQMDGHVMQLSARINGQVKEVHVDRGAARSRRRRAGDHRP